jgi:hypothetical protein
LNAHFAKSATVLDWRIPLMVGSVISGVRDPARLARGATWVSLLGILALTLTPLGSEVHAPGLLGYDKIQHLVAFAGLASLAGTGWGLKNAFRIAVALSFVAASIELLQGLPLVHRDPSIWDWAAGNLGIAFGLGLLNLAASSRSRWASPPRT